MMGMEPAGREVLLLLPGVHHCPLLGSRCPREKEQQHPKLLLWGRVTTSLELSKIAVDVCCWDLVGGGVGGGGHW